MEANNVNQKVKTGRALKCKKKKKNLSCFQKIMETKTFDDQHYKDKGKKELQQPIKIR